MDERTISTDNIVEPFSCGVERYTLGLKSLTELSVPTPPLIIPDRNKVVSSLIWSYNWTVTLSVPTVATE